MKDLHIRSSLILFLFGSDDTKAKCRIFDLNYNVVVDAKKSIVVAER